MALQFVLANGGAAYLPRRMVSPFLEQGAASSGGRGQSLSRPLYLAYLEKSDRRELIDQLLTLPLGWHDADLRQPPAE